MHTAAGFAAREVIHGMESIEHLHLELARLIFGDILLDKSTPHMPAH